MPITKDPTIIATRQSCSVCGDNGLEKAIDLPMFPQIGMYSNNPEDKSNGSVDQELLFCQKCGHGQLSNVVDPQFLYGDEFSFRTSVSASARHGTSLLLSALDEIAKDRKFKCILDLGCNDLYLLGHLHDRGEQLIGVDPIWAGREHENEDPQIQVVGLPMEAVDVAGLETKPDLIICRHTMEHIQHPPSILKKVIDAAAPDALFLFEVPDFQAMVERLRFDQITHQHLQYFSIQSIRRLLEIVGATYQGRWDNFHDWGGLLFAFTKADNGSSQPATPDSPYNLDKLQTRYRLFQSQMRSTSEALQLLKGPSLYGYGASATVPTLAYHLGNDLKDLTAILDDDPAKDGFYYYNLPVPIRHPDCVEDYEASSMFVTAMDNVKPILTKLLASRPRHIIYPFNLM